VISLNKSIIIIMKCDLIFKMRKFNVIKWSCICMQWRNLEKIF